MIILHCAKTIAASTANQATSADWFEAWGTVAAALIAAWTLWKLYQRDEQRGEMIEELKTQAGQSIVQSKHLGAQVDQLTQQVFQLERIHEAIAQGIRIMAKSEELNQELRKIKIRPQFEFESSMLKPGHMEAHIKLLNRGGTAYKFAARILKGVDVQFRMPESVSTGEQMNMLISSSQRMDDFQPHIELQFVDEEGTRYAQRVLMDSMNIKVTQPTLVEKR